MKIYFLLFLYILVQALHIGSADAQSKIFNTVLEGQANFGPITSIAQDRQGYIWFTSGGGSNSGSAGLNKYDGHTITSYSHDSKNNNSLADDKGECVIIDSAGIMWIGTYGSGLDRFDPSTNTFTHFRHSAGNTLSLSNDTIQCLLVDDPGHLWVGTRNGLNLFSKETGKCTRFISDPGDASTLSNNNVRILYKDHRNTLWIGCGLKINDGDDDNPEDGGLNRYDRAAGKFTRYLHDPRNPNSIANNKVRAIFEDSKGNFWVGTAGNGLHTLDRATGNFTHYYYDPAHPEKLSRPYIDPSDPSEFISFITEDANGDIWIGSCFQGINKYDPATKKITHYGATVDLKASVVKKPDTTSGLPYQTLFYLWNAFPSKDGLMWITTLTGNLLNVDVKKTTIPFYPTKSVNTFYADPKTSVLWIGTDSGLIEKRPGTAIEKRWVHDPLNKNSLSYNRIWAIRADDEGKLWISTGNGLNKFDPLTNTFTLYRVAEKATNPGANFFNSLLIDHNKNIWLASNQGLYRMEQQTGKFNNYTANSADSNSLSENTVTCLIQDADNSIWVGTYRGLNRLDDKTGKFQHYLNNSIIGSVFTDASGVLWAGAFDGLFRYNRATNEFTRYIDVNTKTEIIDVLNVMEDDKMNLWITTAKELVKINKSRDTVKIYGESYGVHSNNFDYVNNLKAANGELFFGDPDGYYAFFPDELKDNGTAPRVNFTSFKLSDEEVSPTAEGILTKPIWNTKEIKLSYKQNVFSFEFVGIDYKSKSQPKYLFMLENYDNNWRPVGIDRKAFLFNIPPGEYIFHVRAVNADGLWGENQISIIIAPPFWETWWFRVLSVVALVIVIYAIIRERSRKLKAENLLLEKKVAQRTHELQEEKEKVESTLTELKSTQAQLIQQEKMASLGELTAGIAHEIQNPLNFVNNFSEVNKEMLEELKAERLKPKAERDDKLEDDIINDLIDNEEKINHHGKRADSIVKGMLQHSKASTGQKELTDINALCDEYLRLAYHGLRAKDKSFNAEIKTDFDEAIGKINIVPQDIGRVLLNLYNNAFYAVNEKFTANRSPLTDDYKPLVSIQTKKINDKVEIIVSDNGNGIPQNIVDKIFQPFFTTKPTGQGTGLGLSLAYDIIKAHGGEIKVKTKEGEGLPGEQTGTEFIIWLPIV